MSIIRTEEVKELLGIARENDSYDKFIEKALPGMKNFLFSVTNNTFEAFLDEIYLEADTISFAAGEPASISDSDSGFTDAGFVNGMLIRVSGSLFNDGVYKIKTVNDGKLELELDENLTTESAGRTIEITFVKIPEEAKLFIAKVIEYYFPSKASLQGIESEKFDDYSVKFNLKSDDIPESIMAIIKPYVKLNWD